MQFFTSFAASASARNWPKHGNSIPSQLLNVFRGYKVLGRMSRRKPASELSA